MPHSPSRIDGIDIARGLSMLLVVIMHSTIGVEAASGRAEIFHRIVDFATGFRIPAFFLISGLFFAKAMRFSLEELFRRRIFGLLALYLIWLVIHVTIRSIGPILTDPASGLIGKDGLLPELLLGLIEPFGALWFIYLLAVFALVGWLVRAMPGWLVVLLAAALESLRIQTGWTLIDEFCARFVYFQLGLMVSPLLLPQRAAGDIVPSFVLKDIATRPVLPVLLLVVWGVVQSLLVVGGYDRWRIFSLLDGVIGAGALLLIGALVAQSLPLKGLKAFLLLMGRRSIVVYLVFTIPMALMRMMLLRFFPDLPLDLMVFIVVVAAIATALLLERLSRRSRLIGRLFERPVL